MKGSRCLRFLFFFLRCLYTLYCWKGGVKKIWKIHQNKRFNLAEEERIRFSTRSFTFTIVLCTRAIFAYVHMHTCLHLESRCGDKPKGSCCGISSLDWHIRQVNEMIQFRVFAIFMKRAGGFFCSGQDAGAVGPT